MSDTAVSNEVQSGGGIAFRQPKTASSDTSTQGSVIPDITLDPAALMDFYKNIQSVYSPSTAGMPGVQDLLTRLSGSLYDPTQDLKAVGEKSALASTLPTGARQAADNAQVQSQGADYLLQQLQGVPVPQETPLAQPNLPSLELPGAPPVAQAKVNPLASLIALGAGFAAPRAAGQFHAAALEGAIKGAQQENARRQQANKDEITRRSLVYDASMQAAKERERVVEINRDAAFQNSVLTTDKQLSLAKARGEQFMARGAAKSLKDFADKYDPAIKAAQDVKSLYDAIDTKGKASAEQVKSISELLSAVDKAGASGRAMSKDIFDTYVKASLQHKQEADILNRQQIHDKAVDERTQRQSDAIGQREMGLHVFDANESLKKLGIEEAGKDRRQQAYRDTVRNMKPSQSLVQSQENQKRLQTNLHEIEKAIAETNASRTGGSGDAAISARVNSLRGSLQETTKALQQEQLRAMRFDPAKSGSPVDTGFDPETGDLIPR